MVWTRCYADNPILLLVWYGYIIAILDALLLGFLAVFDWFWLRLWANKIKFIAVEGRAVDDLLFGNPRFYLLF